MNKPIYMSKKRTISHAFPDELMYSFGTPKLAMILPLDGRKKLIHADLDKVKQALTDQGYYLQLPPPSENLLKKHLAEQGNKSD